MKSKVSILILITFISCINIYPQATPYLKNTGKTTQLIVDDKPFIMISGELHNSSSSTIEYLTPLFPGLKSMNLNSVIASISWEQFEPEEGKYDFSLLESLITNAEKNDLKLCLIWFASWKNGQSSYLPLWVKKDTKRFFRVKTKDGKNIETISPFCDEACKADAKAFAAMMKHIRDFDKNKTVVMIQPENEVGIFQDIDYNNIALKKLEEDVPQQLIAYMQKNKKILQEELKANWVGNGTKAKGSWKEVFGDNVHAKAYFMTWQYASYINEVATKGKKEYPLPMFVNAWIVQEPDDLPGVYPNGGPVSKVMDIYKAAAENIDIVCPDIYLPDFKGIVAMYHREDNPLLVPESTLNAGRAFYAFAQHDAICYSPFGIEGGMHDIEFKNGYGVLNELMPLITKYQGTGRMVGILKEGDERECEIKLGNYDLKIVYEDKKEPCYGLIIRTDDNEFIIAGMNMSVYFSTSVKNKVGYIGQVWEGGFKDNEWVPTRLLNGDETWHNEVLRVFGQRIVTSQVDNESVEAVKSSQPFFYSANIHKVITTPGIYKVITYIRD